ncbi:MULTISPECIES: dTDP-4-dehydrorhamnose reductase [Bizionia]|uniref:dTDP-4-dehydrorhamnose reductase n=1 Tax=Bizionia algoritergicola TaxID=291187 RepID=A0A5D0R278_9FLAO|nr:MULTISPECIES: dTDP-4-dehydrorhamnose reductase [Bizionia]OBX21654.1 dTDP-4-dehydrorhamnose reductase [Bizionia sp. APA-3]TYB75085.1 dTDP-4-dehydrorhamnose reductase [Bizionia algoritergicola]
MKTDVLVTGSNGQLGKSLFALNKANNYEALNFTFATKATLDISNQEQVDTYFQSNSFNYCINCAAYTAVDKAEVEKEEAFLINATGAENLAEACKKYGVVLIHISTDFVFDGSKREPYLETDTPNPINVYGASKLEGERNVQSALENHFIIRTSWLYSEFGNNFVKTMLRLGSEKDELHVVNDQLGSPTYAKDLAEVVLEIILSHNKKFGLYHYSNQGVLSWFDFAQAIFNFTQNDISVKPIPTSGYPTPAQRPQYSVLSSTKIVHNLRLEEKSVLFSLINCLQNI